MPKDSTEEKTPEQSPPKESTVLQAILRWTERLPEHRRRPVLEYAMSTVPYYNPLGLAGQTGKAMRNDVL